MKIFRKKDNRGLSIVELICAVAIFAVIGTVVGSVMVVSANSYKRSTDEVELQQEAQLTANQLTDILIDTTADVSYASGMLTVRRTENVGGSEVTRVFEITYVASDQKLVYSEYIDYGGGTVTLVGDANQLLAENVTDFDVDLADFGDKNARVKLAFEKNGKTYESWYTVAARNEMETSEVAVTANIVTMSEITLEPNEDYILEAEVVGTVSNKAVVWENLSGNTSASTLLSYDGSRWHIQIGADETGDASGNLSLTVSTDAKNEGTTVPMRTLPVTVKIRRVNDMTFNGNRISGDEYKTNAVYKVNADATGTHFARELGVDYDSVENYKNPAWVKLEYKFFVGGVEQSLGTYVDVNEHEDMNSPYAELRLKQDMPGDSRLVAYATAKHPAGVLDGNAYNKKSTDYDSIIRECVLAEKPADAGTPTPPEGPDGPHEVVEGGLRRGGTAKVRFPQDKLNAIVEANSNARVQVNQWRYRPEGETVWLEWRGMIDTGGVDFGFQADDLKNLLAPDKGYDIQVRTIMNDYSGNMVWPLAETPESEYITNFHISKVQVYFKGIESLGVPDNCMQAGSYSSPITVGRQPCRFRIKEVVGATTAFGKDLFKVQLTQVATGKTKEGQIATNMEPVNGIWVEYAEVDFGFENFQHQNGVDDTGIWKVELIYKNGDYIYNTNGSGNDGPGVFYFNVTD